MVGKWLTGPVNTVFDLDDQVPVRDVTLFRAFAEDLKKKTRSQIEVTAGKSIEAVAMIYSEGNPRMSCLVGGCIEQALMSRNYQQSRGPFRIWPWLEASTISDAAVTISINPHTNGLF